MEKLTEDLNIISKLQTRPTENEAELKGKWDEAGNIIKNYINGPLNNAVSNLENDVKDCVTEKEFEELSKDLTENINKKIEEVDRSIEQLENSAMNYEDIVREFTAPKILDHKHGGTIVDAQTITKAGYMPIGIVGHRISGTVTPNYTDAQPQLLSMYLSNISAGTCKTNVKIKYSNNDDWTYKSTYELQIAWAKIKS